MERREAAFRVYRKDYDIDMGRRAGKRGIMIGAIRAQIGPCGEADGRRFSRGGKEATHILTEELFTITRPGDALINGLVTYDVLGVEDCSGNGVYSFIYVRRRGEEK